MKRLHLTAPRLAAIAAGLTMSACPVAGFSWGDEGHEIIARVAEHYLDAAVRAKVTALLATDATGLTRGTGIAAEATWADKFRDSDRDTARVHYLQTRAWHYIDIEIDGAGGDVACSPHTALQPQMPASRGPADDCIIDKIDQFRAELRAAATAPDERRLALQFLLHLVGDVHQPLHAADHHDHGGNDVRVESAGHRPGSLHHYWDAVFVERLGTRADEVAARLIAEISARHRRSWSSGTPAEWARQSFEVARIQVYGRLPRIEIAETSGRSRGTLELDERYDADAKNSVAVQLERAGLRLARLLNEALR